ncbi:hypothetical protein CO660_31230 [Rhizobium sp. L9]|nr:hypothetical protein CO665_34915 [Rhizobium anhuiense]PDS54313.1 hypothetical protein CO663_36040 [Rhizobium anhuiense]PDS76825.1 hypothetical protein CO654_34845 [Rhizobium sp. L18]PDT25841.1 hypothetical protein CO660_31230 [Rhizobium sp. L9]PDV84615.1 hypothetical protein CO652_31235 [Rhizobium sp. H4]
MSLVIGGLSVRLVLNNPTLAENTDGRPQSRSPATAQREARGRSALLPPVSYTRCWDTIGKWPTRLLCDQPLSSTNRIASCKKLRK